MLVLLKNLKEIASALKSLGLPVVLTVVLIAFLIWLVKKILALNQDERTRSQSDLNAERSRHQEFLSDTVKGFTDELTKLTDQNRITSEIQYKLIDHMTQYTQHIENSYDRLEKGNRSQWEEHVKMLNALGEMTNAIVTLEQRMTGVQKELVNIGRK